MNCFVFPKNLRGGKPIKIRYHGILKEPVKISHRSFQSNVMKFFSSSLWHIWRRTTNENSVFFEYEQLIYGSVIQKHNARCGAYNSFIVNI